MKESREDRIIERYINGEMRPDEERDFRALLEMDEELRRKMEAEKVVQRVLRQDREEMQHEESGSYARFLAALATSVPAAEGALVQSMTGSSSTAGSSAAAGSATGGLATAGSAGLSTGFLPGLLAAGGVVKGIVATLAAVTVATGIYVASPGEKSSDEREPAAATATPTHVLPMTDSSAVLAPAPAPQTVPSADAPLEVAAPATTTTEPDATVTSPEQPAGQTESVTPKSVATPAEKTEDELDAILKSMEKDASRQIDVIESDSAAAQVQIGTKKKQ